MICRQLAQTAVSIPEVGLGTWRYNGGIEPLRRGLEEGALFIDTAESYGSEPVVGQAVKGLRPRVFIATKVSPDHFRYSEVLKAADRSLRQLEVDHIDLYQLHFPNYFVPLDETLGAMEALVEAGKVRFIGVSNFSVSLLKRAQRALRKHKLVSNQVRYNLVDRTIEPALMSYCQANQITIIAYSPLARGLDRIVRGDPTGVLARVAKEAGKTMAQVAINWCLCKDRVVAIPKANSVDHVVEDCGASDWRLTEEQIHTLNQHIRFRRRSRIEILLRWRVAPPLLRLVKAVLKRMPFRLSGQFA